MTPRPPRAGSSPTAPATACASPRGPTGPTPPIRSSAVGAVQSLAKQCRAAGVVTAPPWSLWAGSRRGRYATAQSLHQSRSEARLPRMVLEAEPEVSRLVAERMADAARAWLDSLTGEQRQVASGATPTDDATDAERRRWFYTPTDHGGL